MKRMIKTLLTVFSCFTISAVFFIQPLFAFNTNDLETINKILIKQETQDQKIENLKDGNLLYIDFVKNSTEALNIKNEGIDFKSHYYDLAIKTIYALSIVVLAVVIALGFYKKQEIDSSRKEIREDLAGIKNDINEKLNYEIKKFQEEKDKFISNMRTEYDNELLSLREKFKDNSNGRVPEVNEDENSTKTSQIDFE